MIKVLLTTFLLIIILVAGLCTYALVMPYYYYNQIVNKGVMNKWYSISEYREIYVTPGKTLTLNLEKKINENLWQEFHYKNLSIPLPVKNPFYFVAPILKYNTKKQLTEFGLSIYDAKNEMISQIYFLPGFQFPNVMNSQKMFELPIVSNHIHSLKKDDVWRDLFSKDITNWDVPYKEMVQNLYLLALRSKIITEKTKSYQYISDIKKGVFELEYADKDFESNLVLSIRNNKVLSYLIISRKDNIESQKIKFKMLKDIDFKDTTPTLSNVIYQEFKNLGYRNQVDHLGMLYLISAWSHDQKRLEILISAIQFLERGLNNQRQLEPLYKYLYSRTGKTFSKKRVNGLELPSDILLKRNIELENAVESIVVEEVTSPEKKLSVEEQYKKILNETKKRLKSNPDVMRID